MRRVSIAISLVLALLLAGCVQITNPQFDARYRVHAEPVAPTTYAVFAVWGSPDTSASAPVKLVVVEPAKRSVVGSIALGEVRSLTDLGGGADSDAALLAATRSGFAAVDAAKRTVRPVPALFPDGSAPVGVALQGGSRLLWAARPGAIDIIRRTSIEQTATLDLRAFAAELPAGKDSALATVGPLTYAGSRNLRDAYFVSWVPSAGGKADKTTTVWKVDFPQHTVGLSTTPTPWPAQLEATPETHADRAVRRFGAPTSDPSGTGAIVFAPPTAPSDTATLQLSSGPTRLIFEPGGEKYFTVEPGAPLIGIGLFAARVTERSILDPAFARDMPVVPTYSYPATGFTPLGVIGDSFAFYRVRSQHGMGVTTSEYELVLRDLKSGAETPVVRWVDQSARVDYLGTFTR